MISFLRGNLIDKLADAIIIDVNGIGYEVRVTPRLWQQARQGSVVQLYTHFQVREDAQMLYGFADLAERDMFRTLLSVSGVGPKTAMAVLSAVTPDEIIQAVQTEDAAALKAPGVGPKIVKRLILELKSKLGDLPFERGSAAPAASHGDVLAAMEQLGYTTIEVRTALEDLETVDLNTADIIRLLLQRMRS